MVFLPVGNIYVWFCVAVCFRHARAPFPTGWGSVAHKPLPGRGGGRKKRHETTGASTRHADDHYLTPLYSSVNDISMSLLFSGFCAHFILAKHLHWPSPHSSTDLFNITNMRGKVAKFCIFKTVYRLGEDIIGTFTFSEGDIPCLQVQITLKPFILFFPFGFEDVFRTKHCQNVACDLSTQWACRVRRKFMSSIRGDQLRRSVSQVMAGIWSPASTQPPATSPCLFLSTLHPVSALTSVRSPSCSVYWSSAVLCNVQNGVLYLWPVSNWNRLTWKIYC